VSLVENYCPKVLATPLEKSMLRNALTLALFALTSTSTLASEPSGPIVDTLRGINADARVDHIGPTPIVGLQEVVVDDTVVYLSTDGRYLFQGQILDLKEQSNLTELAKAVIRGKVIATIDRKQVIRFSPAKPKHEVFVFTDIDCGYCQKLHEEIGAYLAAGIAVNYLAFPRAGLGTPSFTKAISVWCSDKPADALTQAKAGKEIPKMDCDNPVSSMFDLGRKLGVSGTPAIFTTDGTQLGGYLPPDAMIQRLEGMAVANKAG